MLGFTPTNQPTNQSPPKNGRKKKKTSLEYGEGGGEGVILLSLVSPSLGARDLWLRYLSLRSELLLLLLLLLSRPEEEEGEVPFPKKLFVRY